GAEADRRRVERVFRVGESHRVGPFEARAYTPLASISDLAAGAVEHALGEVAAHHLAAGGDPTRELDREVAGPRRDVEHTAPRADAREVDRTSAPAVMQPCGHRRVHPVVDAGDAVAHRAHLSGL